MAWIWLLIAGAAEIGGVTFIKLSDGFRRWKPTVGFGISSAVSFYFLSLALRDIPIGTAYSIWTGIGAAGSVLLGMALFGESRDKRKLLFIAMIIAGVAGLRFLGA
ncbi:MAG: supressor protein SugE [Thermobacillus sp. ZCTH02-B1]|jgi:quaternary ammonium compound-resistance protein SugE|uniref:DMT family transporter n=1 Tax=Thermobacillus sp. ZCTH02-B1 TaxID=1858795 RepID=UPI000B550224|nr:multidrug efflux SMR transporter [Thermobacillus sp. ZCTH02-B1]OUM94076.1 MAG: supressor protein SugE [Thermobacillus sp. ZCTH02-B1]